MPRILALFSLSLAFVAATLPADARQALNQDRRPSPTVAKKSKINQPAPHWSSIAPDVDRAGSLPGPGRVVGAPAVGGMPTVPFPGRGSIGGPRCDIVVKRPGGNPTQDMTGSIGHAKSHQSNGGPGRMRICDTR